IESNLNRSQFVTGSQKHRDPRFRPWVFTEHGAVMVASVLNSKRAVEVSTYVVRAFVKPSRLPRHINRTNHRSMGINSYCRSGMWAIKLDGELWHQVRGMIQVMKRPKTNI